MLVLRRVLVIATLVLVMASTVQAQIAHGYSNVFALDTVTAVDDSRDLPPAAALQSIYPNPFNPQTTIEFALVEGGVVDLSIFDLRGRLIRKLDHAYRAAGHYRVTWSGQDRSGHGVPSGAYFCRLTAAGESQTAKLTLAK